jgi:transcriptional regulator with XRE-family HTH domain
MTTVISSNTPMVNPAAELGRKPEVGMDEHTIASRLRWILENRKDPTGKDWSQRSLSAAAKLSQSHVNALITGRIHPSKAGLDTLAKIAEAAGVSVAWLEHGTDPPSATPGPVRYVESIDLYPSRPEAIAMLRGEGVAESIISALAVRRLRSPEDPGLEYWLSEAVKLKRRQSLLRAELELDERPTAAAPKTSDEETETIMRPKGRRR